MEDELRSVSKNSKQTTSDSSLTDFWLMLDDFSWLDSERVQPALDLRVSSDSYHPDIFLHIHIHKSDIHKHILKSLL